MVRRTDYLKRREETRARISSALKAAQETVDMSTQMQSPPRPRERSPLMAVGAVHSDTHNYKPPAGRPEGLSEAAFNQALNKMLAASGGKIRVFSGKRSTQRQVQLWQQALKKYGSPERARKFVAPPGKSFHEKGLAADLKYADAATRAWAHTNAAKYGLHFPMAWENWHIEPIGSRRKK